MYYWIFINDHQYFCRIILVINLSDKSNFQKKKTVQVLGLGHSNACLYRFNVSVMQVYVQRQIETIICKWPSN